MAETPLWVKAATSLGATVALVLVVWRLQSRAKEARTAGAKAAERPVGAKEAASSEAKPAAQPVAAVAAAKAAPTVANGGSAQAPAAGGIEAQKAAMAGAADRPWAPNFSEPLEADVERRLRARYNPTYLDIENQGNSCGALKLAIVMVSEAFKGQTRINRQREVQSLLKPDLDTGRLHALSLMLKTPEEQEKLLASKQSEEK